MEHGQGGTTSAASLADLIALNEELAALARIGLPLEPQLRRLGRELPGMSGKLAERIGARMEQGTSLSNALAAEQRSVPEVYRAVVDAGIRSGRLPAALEALVDSGNRLDQLRRATGVALVYPVMATAIAWALLIFAFTFVLPTFDWFDLPTGATFGASLQLPKFVALATMTAATGVLAGLVYWWWSTGHAAALDRAALVLEPPSRQFYHVRHLASVAMFAELLRLMIEQDTPLGEALAICSRATSDRRLSEAARDLAAQLTTGASTDATAVEKFPPLIALALRHADRRPLMLSGLAQAEAIYRDRAENAAHWITEYLPVLLVACVGGSAVASLAAIVLWPYISMLYTLSGPFWF
jgi:general secretion pathway protein F